MRGLYKPIMTFLELNKMANSNYKLWSHPCAFPGCNTPVSYHKATKGTGNGPYFKFMTFCPHHRKGSGKAAVDIWKLSQGCANAQHQHYGIKCTSNITSATQLDVNHIDGNRSNNNQSNIEILCKICHQQVTILSNHHKSRYINQVELDPNLFEVSP
jgi:hypothetical protein